MKLRGFILLATELTIIGFAPIFARAASNEDPTGNTKIPPSFRKQAIQEQNEQIQSSAITPVAVDAAGQPGYIPSTARGNLAAYSEANSYHTFQLNETRTQLQFGLANLVNKNITGESEFEADLRYRLSPRPWPEAVTAPWRLGAFPLSLFLELGVLPGTDSTLRGQQTTMVNALTTDQNTLRFGYESHLAVIDEFPHGHQSWIIPEMGVGISLISTEVRYFVSNIGTTLLPPNNLPDSSFVFKNYDKDSVEPYFSFGLHLFPEHFISLNLRGSYIALNYPDTIQIPDTTGFSGTPFPGHALVTNAPSAVWALSALLQMKLVWPTLTHTPIVPQLMPPWLLPSYTTDDISPWVASPEVTQRWNQPGHPSVGNVMFQYKNKWVNKVEIIGDFSDWVPEPMIKDRSGIWVCVKDLPVGKFRYNFVLDGKKEILDPWNKNIDANSREHGSSILAVK